MAPSTIREQREDVTRAQWDAAAEGWNGQASNLRRWLGPATEAMLDMADVRPGMRVLDVAAGAGDQSCDIARRAGPGGELLVTDLSPEMLAAAAINLRSAGYAHALTLVANGEALGLEGADFDAAVCRLGLMFFANPTRGLQSIRRALRPGGRFSAMVFSGPSGNSTIPIVASIAMRHAGLKAEGVDRPGGLMSLGKPGLVGELFDAAGFIDVEVRRIDAPLRLESVHQYLDFLRTAAGPIMTILDRIDEASRHVAWDEIADALAGFNSPEGWEAPTELLLAAGAR